MEHIHSKRSLLTSTRTFDQTLTRGHNSEIMDVKRRLGYRRHSTRKTFTFKGSQPKRAPSQSISKQRGAAFTPASSRNASMMQNAVAAGLAAASAADKVPVADSTRAKRTRSTSRICTPPTVRSRSRSTVRQTGSQRPALRAASRAASMAGSQPASRRSSSVAAGLAGTSVTGAAQETAAAEPNLRPPPPPPAPLQSDPANAQGVLVTHAPLSPPDFIKTEESKLVSSPLKISDSEEEEADGDNDDDDDTDQEQVGPNVTIEVPKSPSVVGYRKLEYSEAEHKWIEHWKVVEDLKRARERKKREAQLAKIMAKVQPPARKVKGRSTARMQVMFPTAIVKQDRRNGFVHNINMTDALRIELHKRKAPIVPSFYQQHILDFGKLPFRNNPRPHPVV